MTTDRLHQCQDPQWAVARIEGLEGEITGLKKDWLNDRKELITDYVQTIAALKFCIEAVDRLPEKWRNRYSNPYQSGTAAKTCAEELTAALHPQEPSNG